MDGSKLLSIITNFSTGTDQYLFIDEFLVKEEFDQFINTNKLLFLEEESDELNLIYWLDSIFLLWDQELMTLELYKNLIDLKKHILERKETENLQLFSDLATYLENASIDFEQQNVLESNLDQTRIANNLSINSDKLDYSPRSLELIDKQLQSLKIDNQFIEENLPYLSLYIGKTYLKEHSGKWMLQPIPGFNGPLPMIETADGKTINVLRIVHVALTSKHGNIIFPSGIYRTIAFNPFTPFDLKSA